MLHMPKLNNEFFLEPLSWENLNEAVVAAKILFPYYRSTSTNPESWLRMHLKDSGYRGCASQRRVKNTQYFLLKDSVRGRLAGIIGYSMRYGSKHSETVWLDWFGICPKFQGRGLGTLLLRWVQRLWLRKGFVRAKLFTSSRKVAAIAQNLYDSQGFIVTRTYVARDRPYRLFLRKKML